MPRAPRGKRVVDPSSGSFVVVNRAVRGHPDPYFDKTRGVWVAPWRKADGKVGRPTGRTRVAAEASRDRHIAAERDAEKLAPLSGGFTAATTVRELSAWWLEHVVQHRVRATSLSTYTKHMRVVCERLGDVAVRRLQPEQVAGFISELALAGSASRARNIRMLLVQLLDEAVNLGLADDNVARRVRSPRVQKEQRRTLSPTEVAALLAKCDQRFAAAVALCFVQGWRVSEALGLAWQDLDLEAGTVRVRRAATYADGVGMVLGPPKTSRTAGRQLLAPTVVRLLTAHRARWMELREAAHDVWPVTVYDEEAIDLVFVNPAGDLLTPGGLQQQGFQQRGGTGSAPQRASSSSPQPVPGWCGRGVGSTRRESIDADSAKTSKHARRPFEISSRCASHRCNRPRVGCCSAVSPAPATCSPPKTANVTRSPAQRPGDRATAAQWH